MKTNTITEVILIIFLLFLFKFIQRLILFIKRNSQAEKEFFEKYYTIEQGQRFLKFKKPKNKVKNNLTMTKKPVAVVYQVVSCNLDVDKEARHYAKTWIDRQTALEAVLKMMIEQNSKCIQFIAGDDEVMKEYEGLNIERHPARKCDGYYNRSYFSDHRCLTYINEIEIWQ